MVVHQSNLLVAASPYSTFLPSPTTTLNAVSPLIHTSRPFHSFPTILYEITQAAKADNFQSSKCMKECSKLVVPHKTLATSIEGNRNIWTRHSYFSLIWLHVPNQLEQLTVSKYYLWRWNVIIYLVIKSQITFIKTYGKRLYNKPYRWYHWPRGLRRRPWSLGCLYRDCESGLRHVRCLRLSILCYPV
jgi:hypothetical protein